VLIAQLSDVHVGGSRYREELLRTAIEEVNEREPDLAVIAGDLTDDGYPDQYPLAAQELAALRCPRIVRVPGNHDVRNAANLARLPVVATMRSAPEWSLPNNTRSIILSPDRASAHLGKAGRPRATQLRQLEHEGDTPTSLSATEP
jgi:predicted phosphodiesterase